MDTDTLRIIADAYDITEGAFGDIDDDVACEYLMEALRNLQWAMQALVRNNVGDEPIDDVGGEVADDGQFDLFDLLESGDLDDVSTEDDEYLARFSDRLDEIPARDTFIGLTADGDEIYTWRCCDDYGNFEGYYDLKKGRIVQGNLIGWRSFGEYDFGR